ncbi:MAG: type II toxin-antitoxin system VapC family toxin [Acidobacteriaceae bacterium]
MRSDLRPQFIVVPVNVFESVTSCMNLLPDNESVYREWRRIVVEYGIAGVQVHDARLAATMLVHQVEHILTLNAADFIRYQGLLAIHPGNL